MRVLQNLIEYYEDGIKDLPQLDWLKYLIDKELDLGICQVAKVKFGIDFRKEFELNEKGYYFKLAGQATNREEALQRLKERLGFLKQFEPKASESKIKYIVLGRLKDCTRDELLEQLRYHTEPYSHWEKERIKHIKNMLDESGK